MPVLLTWPVILQEGLPAFAPDPTQARYRYVLFDIWFLTVTRRSVALGSKAAALTFTALQVDVHSANVWILDADESDSICFFGHHAAMATHLPYCQAHTQWLTC